jgi:hypothetical protein
MELPKRLPNHPRQPTVHRSQKSRLPVQRLSQPEPRSRLPVRVDGQKATPCQGRAGGGGESGHVYRSAAESLDWCGRLEKPHGRLME